ncbi:MAG: hypothetical protein QME60_08675 [Verrucomicrobiota bacterium]|nr:hypothetical protein [Verrucomicrobiota bacterium]
MLCPGGVAYLMAEGRWTRTVKPWPQNIDEWTHWLHGADGNAVAKDRLVGPPHGIQWVERPLWQRHQEFTASIPALVSAKGRIFYISDEAPATALGLPERWLLIARDAFNGVQLWSRPLGKWGWRCWNNREANGRFGLPIHILRRLVVVGDRVYATLDFNAPLTALDAATGTVVKTYKGTEFTDEILFQDGLLILSVSQTAQQPGTIAAGPPAGKQVVGRCGRARAKRSGGKATASASPPRTMCSNASLICRWPPARNTYGSWKRTPWCVWISRPAANSGAGRSPPRPTNTITIPTSQPTCAHWSPPTG